MVYLTDLDKLHVAVYLWRYYLYLYVQSSLVAHFGFELCVYIYKVQPWIHKPLGCLTGGEYHLSSRLSPFGGDIFAGFMYLVDKQWGWFII